MKTTDLNNALIILKLERFLRARENNTITWTTKEGKNIPISKLDDRHLDNIISMLESKLNNNNLLLEALGSIGDLEF